MTRRLAVQIGFIIGLYLAAVMIGGGVDGVRYFWRDWWPGATVPAFAFLLTTPFSWLPYPINFAAFAGLSAILIMWSCQRLNTTWLVILTPPILWLLWLGQLEPFVVIGAALAVAVGRGNRPAVWAGPAWLLLLVKPTVGIGVALWLVWRLWKLDGAMAIWIPAIIVIAVLLLTIALYGPWGADWLHVMTHFDEPVSHDNFAGWPYGAILLLALALPISLDKQPGFVAALTTFVMPYARIYHLTLLLVLAGSPLLIALSWVATGLYFLLNDALYMIWLPGAVIALTLWHHTERGQLWQSRLPI